MPRVLKVPRVPKVLRVFRVPKVTRVLTNLLFCIF